MHENAHPFILCFRTLAYTQVICEGIDERTLEMTVSGMHHHSGRLVYHEHVVVFVHYVERNVLRQDLEAPAAIRHNKSYHIAGTNYVIGLHDLVAYVHIAFLNCQLHAMTRCVLEMLRHIFVYAHRALPCIDVKSEMLEKFRFYLYFFF